MPVGGASLGESCPAGLVKREMEMAEVVVQELEAAGWGAGAAEVAGGNKAESFPSADGTGFDAGARMAAACVDWSESGSTLIFILTSSIGVGGSDALDGSFALAAEGPDVPDVEDLGVEGGILPFGGPY